MLTLEKAITQAKELGAVKYGEIYMCNDDTKKGSSEFKFIHFFNTNDIEVGYFTYSLKDFMNNINVFDGGRVWSDAMLKDLVNITTIRGA